MTRTRLMLIAALIGLSIGATWLWWVMPRKADMSIYAPSNSLLYLESNDLLKVVDTIVSTDAWKRLAPEAGIQTNTAGRKWYRRFLRWTGIGPLDSVILARSQIALVVTEFGTNETGQTLNIRPEGALIIETHTMGRRIRLPIEQALNRLAHAAYIKPTYRQTVVDGTELLEWVAPDGSRRLLAAFVGSLVIIGNSERVVQNCLSVAHRRQPSLKDDAELQRNRVQLGGVRSLTFGYAPAKNSARLLSMGLPLLLGRSPDDAEFQRLVASAASRIFGSLAWSSHALAYGIEDRYVISLSPSILSQLKPSFEQLITNREQQILPDYLYSFTSYRFRNPLAVWQGLRTSVSATTDTLSAVLFSSVLKAALIPYGISQPDEFLKAVEGEVVTMRLDEEGEHSLLVARVSDQSAMRELLTKTMSFKLRRAGANQAEMFDTTEGDVSAALTKDLVLLGPQPDVLRYSQTISDSAKGMTFDRVRQVTFFIPLTTKAPIVSYTSDEDRLRGFFAALSTIRGIPVSESIAFERALDGLPFSATETTLTDTGIERVTRSPLGQFSTLLMLFVSNQPAPVADTTPVR